LLLFAGLFCSRGLISSVGLGASAALPFLAKLKGKLGINSCSCPCTLASNEVIGEIGKALRTREILGGKQRFWPSFAGGMWKEIGQSRDWIEFGADGGDILQ
jgi:hypothetical protein